LIHGDAANARILVGGITHFEKRMLTESEAMAKAGRLLKGAGSSQKKAKGNDLEILNLVRGLVDVTFQQTLMQGVSSAIWGSAIQTCR